MLLLPLLLLLLLFPTSPSCCNIIGVTTDETQGLLLDIWVFFGGLVFSLIPSWRPVVAPPTAQDIAAAEEAAAQAEAAAAAEAAAGGGAEGVAEQVPAAQHGAHIPAPAPPLVAAGGGDGHERQG